MNQHSHTRRVQHARRTDPAARPCIRLHPDRVLRGACNPLLAAPARFTSSGRTCSARSGRPTPPASCTRSTAPTSAATASRSSGASRRCGRPASRSSTRRSVSCGSGPMSHRTCSTSSCTGGLGLKLAPFRTNVYSLCRPAHTPSATRFFAPVSVCMLIGVAANVKNFLKKIKCLFLFLFLPAPHRSRTSKQKQPQKQAQTRGAAGAAAATFFWATVFPLCSQSQLPKLCTTPRVPCDWMLISACYPTCCG